MPGVDLTGFDGGLQVIFLRGEGAGGVIGESARRVVGFIEIHENHAILMGIGVMITTGWIRGVAVGRIHELDEEPVIG